MPRRLSERHKCHRMNLLASIVGFFGLTDLRRQICLEQSSSGSLRFKHHRVQKHLAAICPDHPYWSDLSSFFAHVKIRGTTKVHTRVCKIDGALGVVWESC